MKVKVEFIEPILGTCPSSKTIAEDFTAGNAPSEELVEDEVSCIEETEENRGMTIFSRYEGKPIIWDYQIKGAFKDACGMLSRLKNSGNESSKLKAYKKIIDGLIFVNPRHIPINFEGEIGSCQRPLRAQTAQGERVSLANSEEIPAGATIEFEVECLDPAHEKAVIEWLNYGRLRGFGQWRNSGKGRYLFDILDENGNVIGGNRTKAS